MDKLTKVCGSLVCSGFTVSTMFSTCNGQTNLYLAKKWVTGKGYVSMIFDENGYGITHNAEIDSEEQKTIKRIFK